MSAPTFFKNYGKDSKDLFKKKFDFDYTLKTTNKLSGDKSGSVETGAVYATNGALKGYVKGKYSVALANNLFTKSDSEVEIYTDASSESKASTKFFSKNGFTLNFIAAAKPGCKVFKTNTGAAEFEFSNPNVALNLNAKSDLSASKVDAAVSVKKNQFSVGATAVVQVNGSISNLSEKNFGVEYKGQGYSAALVTEKNGSVLVANYFNKVSDVQTVGAQFKSDLQGASRSLLVGTEYKVSPETTVKSKIDLPSGDAAVAVEQNLTKQGVLLGLSTQFNVKNNFKYEKIGLSVSLGDY